jgi:hypothetical protein
MVLIWFVLSLVWGLLGVAFGPGIVMLIIALMLACSGSVFSAVRKLLGSRLSDLWSYFFVSVINVAFLFLFFDNTYGLNSGTIFLLLFVTTPVYPILFFVSKLRY